MQEISGAAHMCVGRAVFFAAIAIVTSMTGCAFDPALAFRVGAVLTLALAAILIFKGQLAHRQEPKRTEVWLHLSEEARPRSPAAAAAFANQMRAVYGEYARHAFIVSTGMFALSLGFSLMGG